MALIASLPDDEARPLLAQAARIRACYDSLSRRYQDTKAGNAIPLA